MVGSGAWTPKAKMRGNLPKGRGDAFRLLAVDENKNLLLAFGQTFHTIRVCSRPGDLVKQVLAGAFPARRPAFQGSL